MKHSPFVLLFLFLYTLPAGAQVKGDFTITGDITPLTTVWAPLDSLSMVFMLDRRIDTVALGTGRFTYAGRVNARYVPSAYLRIIGPDANSPEPIHMTLPIFLEPGEIQVRFRELPDQGMFDIMVTGTPSNDLLSHRMSRYYDLNYEMLEVAQNSELTDEERMLRVDTLYEQQDSLIRYLYRDLRESPVAPMLAMQHFYGTNLFLEAGRELAELEERFPDHPDLHHLESLWRSMEGLTVGDSIPPVRLTDRQGSPVELRDYTSQSGYLLIDFWSSLSGPNLEEFEALKQLPATYRELPLQLIGISTDRSGQEWLQSLQQYNPPGLQWWDPRHEASQAFHISNYPTRFLVDPQGIIIAKGNFTALPEVNAATEADFF